MEDIHWWSVLCTVVSQVRGILGQIVALLSSLKALNETNFQTKIKTIKLHLLDMNPYLARHVGIVDAPSDIHLIILSASSSTKPSLDGTQSSSVEESPLSPLSQTQSIAILLLYLSPRRPSHIAFSCLSPPSRSCLLSSRSCLLSFRSYLLSFVF